MKGLAKQRAFKVQNIIILGEWELLNFTAGRLLTVLILPGEKTKKSAQSLKLTSHLWKAVAWEHGLHRALAIMGANHHRTGLTAGIESLSTEIPALDIFSLFQHPLKDPHIYTLIGGKGGKGNCWKKKKEQEMRKEDLQLEKNKTGYGGNPKIYRVILIAPLQH